MNATLSELRAQPHISISQLKSFLQCPRRYFLQYVERAQPSFRSAALAFGSAWHATIDEHLLRSTPLAPVGADALKDFFAGELEHELNADGPAVLFDDERDDTGQMLDLGVRMLDAFLGAVPVPEKVVGVEIPFSLFLDDAETGEVLATPLIGGMDAVVRERGVDVAWELKTGKRRWSGDQLEFDLQPTAYRLAARELGYDAEVKLVVTTKATRPDVQIEAREPWPRRRARPLRSDRLRPPRRDGGRRSSGA